MDGVLIDSEALHWESVGDVLQRELGDDAPQLPPRIGWSDQELWPELRERWDLQPSVSELIRARARYAAQRLSAHPPPALPYALATLRHWRLIAPDLLFVVVSASPRLHIDQSLYAFVDSAGQDLFHGRVSGVEDAAYNKPAPDPYLVAMQRLSLPPERCWIVEDSTTGITAALGSGAPVFAVGAHSVSKDLRAHCVADLNTLTDLYNLWVDRIKTSQALTRLTLSDLTSPPL